MIPRVLICIAAVPFAGALVCVLAPRWLARLLSVLIATLVAGLAVASITAGYGSSVQEVGGTIPWLDLDRTTPLFGVLLDPLASILLLVVTIIGFFTVLYSTAYLEQRHPEHVLEPTDHSRYYFWLLLFMGSMAGVALAPNFLQLFVFWEMTTVCSWALISFYHDTRSLRAGFKALVMTHVGGLFFLLALLVLFVKTGSFEFDALAKLSGQAKAWTFFFLMIAAWAKAAQVPLHTWLPDAMEAPTPISAYLHAAAMVKAGVFLMARCAIAGGPLPTELSILLGAMALLTILIALSFYFVQDDLKRLLAFSTIAHLGYVLLGISIGTLGSAEGFRGGVLHIVCHGFSKATLFFCAGSIAYITGSRSISALAGLGRSMPLTATAFFVGVMAVAGIPPFACFWSKFMILAGAMQLPGPIGPVLIVLLIGETLLSFAWMLHVAQRIFFGVPSPLAQVNSEPPLPMSGTLFLLMLGCLVAPIIGMPLVKVIP